MTSAETRRAGGGVGTRITQSDMIHGIRGPFDGVRRPDAGGPAAAQDKAATARTHAAANPARPAAPGAGTNVPVQPPPGTDPELWRVLTGDERAYFAKLGAMGPLTYGRVLSGQMPGAAPSPAPLGVRLDIKV